MPKGKFKTESLTVTSTSADANSDLIYTVPNNYSASVKFLHLGNGTASTKKAYIQIYIADDTSYYYLCNGLSMTANTRDELIEGGELFLNEGDQVRAFIESGMTLDVTVSVEEYYDPNRS